MSAHQTLSIDAAAIWQAGVAAVDSERLVRNAITESHDHVTIGECTFPRDSIRRIIVVGGGKAGAGMAVATEETLQELSLIDRLTGWVNVPSDCIRPTRKIHLHPGRPAGVNEPTAEGVLGTERILELVSQLGPNDVCIVLLSGGGSALLPAPIDGIALEDKQAVTRFLMHAGATIGELNCVRKQLSRIKGGRLATAAPAGTIVTLIISDVIDDPLDVIASGPTVADPTTASQALHVLQHYAKNADDLPACVLRRLEQDWDAALPEPSTAVVIHNCIIGNNALAIQAAAEEATRRGYTVHSAGSAVQGEATAVGRGLAEQCLQIRDGHAEPRPPACLLSGGEPIVHVVPTELPRKGGRNQEVALAALAHLWNRGLNHIALLAGGTDGEDGPTDAAGAVVDAALLERAKALELTPEPFLAINDSYTFFERVDGLLKTGPTHTNVMDLHVALIAP